MEVLPHRIALAAKRRSERDKYSLPFALGGSAVPRTGRNPPTISPTWFQCLKPNEENDASETNAHRRCVLFTLKRALQFTSQVDAEEIESHSTAELRLFSFDSSIIPVQTC